MSLVRPQHKCRTKKLSQVVTHGVPSFWKSVSLNYLVRSHKSPSRTTLQLCKALGWESMALRRIGTSARTLASRRPCPSEVPRVMNTTGRQIHNTAMAKGVHVLGQVTRRLEKFAPYLGSRESKIRSYCPQLVDSQQLGLICRMVSIELQYAAFKSSGSEKV